METDSFCHWDFRDGHLKVADFPPQHRGCFVGKVVAVVVSVKGEDHLT